MKTKKEDFPEFIYRFKVEKVIDGDTLILSIDLGH